MSFRVRVLVNMDFLDLIPDIPEPVTGYPEVYQFSDLQPRLLDDTGETCIRVGTIPVDAVVCRPSFDSLWDIHPTERPTVVMYSKKLPLPRFQQAYGHDYFFSQQNSPSIPVPDILQPFLTWAQEMIPPVNSMLVNWYDPAEKHYIGAHRDSTVGLLPGTPILTLSLGGTRAFRMRPYGVGIPHPPTDILVNNKDVVVIPWSTNLKYTHEVPHHAKYNERRISLTFRCFK